MRLLFMAFWIGLAGTGLSGCAAVSDLFGGDEAPPLEGERISVLGPQGAVEADPELAAVPIDLPAPRELNAWPQTGVTADHLVGHVAAPAGLEPAWQASAGSGGKNNPVLSSPVVVGEQIFIKDGTGRVSALSRSRGERQWRVSLVPEGEEEDLGFGGGLAYDNGRLFVTTAFGRVVALDPSTGQELWNQPIGVPMRAAPTAADGRLFVVTQGSQLFALSQDSGAVHWSYRAIAEPATLLKAAPPAARSDLIVAPFGSGEIVVLRTLNGNVLWGDSLSQTGLVTPLARLSAIAGAPVLTPERIVAIGHGGRFASMDPVSGRRFWTIDVAGTEMPWVAGDMVFAVTAEAQLLAVRLANGRVRWASSLPAFQDPDDREGRIAWNGPVLAGGRLLLTRSDGGLVAVSPEDGSILKEVSAPASSLAPVVVDGTIYVLGRNGTLAAYR